MSGIHDAVLEYIATELTAAMIANVPVKDTSRAGIVKIGPLQGDPSPDEARISITVHENDPDKFSRSPLTTFEGSWNDEVAEIENGPVVTMDRKFSVLARCILEGTRENLDEARALASTVRDRLEKTLHGLSFLGVKSADGEYVSRGIISEDYSVETLQAGGPPDAYDYHTKIRFSILTTRNEVHQ